MLNTKIIKRQRPEQNPIRLDDADLAILQQLNSDARTPNNLLASRAGLAPSTCLGRVRALQRAGIIRGFHADIDARLLGMQVAAMVSIMVRPDARGELLESARALQALPEVQDVFVLGGTPDILVHVICPSVEALRDFVAEHLGTKAAYASTQTNLVFEHLSPRA